MRESPGKLGTRTAGPLLAVIPALFILGAHAAATTVGAARLVMVGDPAKAEKVASPCAWETEWPTHLQPHFQALIGSMQGVGTKQEQLDRLTMPVLTIHGSRDRSAPYGGGRDWALRLPDARLLTIEGAAHASWVDAPEIFFPAVASFLGGRWPGGVERVTSLEPAAETGPPG